MQLPRQSAVAVTPAVEAANPDTHVHSLPRDGERRPTSGSRRPESAVTLGRRRGGPHGRAGLLLPASAPPPWGRGGGWRSRDKRPRAGSVSPGSRLRPSGSRACVSRTELRGPPWGRPRSRPAEQEAGSVLSLRRRSGFESPTWLAGAASSVNHPASSADQGTNNPPVSVGLSEGAVRSSR